MTRAYCPFGNGPQKSTSLTVYNLSGNSVMFSGCVCFQLVPIWHSKQFFTALLLCRFMPGHQYLCLIISFVLESSRCPCLCAILIISSRSCVGGMILSSRFIELRAVAQGLSWPNVQTAWRFTDAAILDPSLFRLRFFLAQWRGLLVLERLL